MPRRIALRTDAVGVTAIYQLGDLDAAAVNYVTGLRLR